jgi:anthranilate synthase component 2
MGLALGGRVVRADSPVHGKTALVEHDGRGVFAGLGHPFEAARYHSLVIDPHTCPDALEVSARVAGQATIMGVRHREWPMHGVQFHPESVLTVEGRRILRNFLEL